MTASNWSRSMDCLAAEARGSDFGDVPVPVRPGDAAEFVFGGWPMTGVVVSVRGWVALRTKAGRFTVPPDDILRTVR